MKKFEPLLSKIFFLAVAFSVSMLFSCEFGTPLYLISGTPVDDRAQSIKTLSAEDLPEIPAISKYSFIVLTDTHFGTKMAEREEERFLEKFKLFLNDSDESLRPRFIVNMGDTLNAGWKDAAEMFNNTSKTWIDNAKTILGVSDYKVYSIPGNHDLYNDGWDVWKDNIWPHCSYYKFSLNATSGSEGFSFYFLDSANGTLGAPQFEDLEKNLKNDSKPKIIFCHYPLYVEGGIYFAFNDTIERNKLIAIYAKTNVKYVFSGHAHNYTSYDFKKFNSVVVPSYVYKHKAAFVTVDEIAQSVEYKVFDY